MSYVATMPAYWLDAPRRPARRYFRPAGVAGYRVHGLGLAPEQIVGQVSSIGTPILTGALAASAASAAAASTAATGAAVAPMILGMQLSIAIPVIGAAIAGVTIGVIELIKLARGCGQTCIVTSEWANQAEALLKKNIDAYFALPAPRPVSARNAAINNFQVVWAQLQQMCGQAGTGAAGQRCISDRQAGACVWRQRADSPLLRYPGEPQPGECWNWFSGYLDPIANDPDIAADSLAADVSAALGVGGGSLLPLVAVGGLLLLAAVL